MADDLTPRPISHGPNALWEMRAEMERLSQCAKQAEAERVAVLAERDALIAALAEQFERTLNAAADKLYALPSTDGAALKGPYWYRQGFTQAADLLRDWADFPAALDHPDITGETETDRG